MLDLIDVVEERHSGTSEIKYASEARNAPVDHHTSTANKLSASERGNKSFMISPKTSSDIVLHK